MSKATDKIQECLSTLLDSSVHPSSFRHSLHRSIFFSAARFLPGASKMLVLYGELTVQIGLPGCRQRCEDALVAAASGSGSR
jgi:hypothetical protein